MNGETDTPPQSFSQSQSLPASLLSPKSPHSASNLVNATKPGRNRDADVRKLVRSHVRTDHVLKTARQTVQTKISSKQVAIAQTPRVSWSTSPRNAKYMESQQAVLVIKAIGLQTSLTTAEYPVEMQLHMHILLDKYLKHTTTTKAYSLPASLPTNPLRSQAWFQFAVTDAAMLHAILYAGALYIALQEGRNESRDTVYHQSQVVLIVNSRLKEPTYVEDSTIGAITCLALGAAISGNQHLWHVHMRGIKEMVRTRGDISSVDKLLQSKIRRSDITGAIDYGARPYITFERSARPSTWSILSLQQRQNTGSTMKQMLSKCRASPDIIKIMTELANFSQAVKFVKEKSLDLLDPLAFGEDLYWIEHKLLAFPKTLPQGSEDQMVDSACRLGSLLYMKAIVQEFPYSVTGNSILLRQLQESLLGLGVSESSLDLQLWLSIVGAVLSKGDLKRWFVGRLGALVSATRIGYLNDEELAMSKLLALRQVLGQAVEDVWLEATRA